MKLDSSRRRKRITAAISSGVPSRPSGVWRQDASGRPASWFSRHPPCAPADLVMTTQPLMVLLPDTAPREMRPPFCFSLRLALRPQVVRLPLDDEDAEHGG